MLHAFTKNSKHVKISVQLNHHSLSKRLTGCARQDCLLPTCSMLTKSVTVSVAV